MNKDEYLKRKEELNKEFQQKHNELDREFALSNNIVDIGDIVSDGSCTIKVEDIKVGNSFCGQPPYTYYEGIKLTKKFEPYKTGDKSCVFVVRKHIRKMITMPEEKNITKVEPVKFDKTEGDFYNWDLPKRKRL